jgi:hypothetical protein
LPEIGASQLPFFSQGASYIWIRLDEKGSKLVASWKAGGAAMVRVATTFPPDMGKQEVDRDKNSLQVQATGLLKKHVNPALAPYLATPPQQPVGVVKVRLSDRNRLFDVLMATLPAAVGAAWGAEAERACDQVLQEYHRRHGQRADAKVRAAPCMLRISAV